MPKLKEKEPLFDFKSDNKFNFYEKKNTKMIFEDDNLLRNGEDELLLMEDET